MRMGGAEYENCEKKFLAESSSENQYVVELETATRLLAVQNITFQKKTSYYVVPMNKLIKSCLASGKST